jgi:sugar O-acyltransferase (sialic acid O-acetyltransferase NeuD family)
MNKKLYIIGAGGHGKVVLDVARSMEIYSDFYFLDHGATADECDGVQVIRDRSLPPDPDPETHVFVAIGMDNTRRLELTREYLARGYRVPVLIHSTAHVAQSASIAHGTVLMAQSAVNPGATIGTACIINTGATVDHDCDIHDGAHISPGAHLSGNVQVGMCSHLGTGCSVKHGDSHSGKIKIGDYCKIGIGAAVISDIPDGVVAAGVPATPLKSKT